MCIITVFLLILLILFMLALLKIKVKLMIRNHFVKLIFVFYVAEFIPIRVDASLCIEYENGLIISILVFGRLKVIRPDLNYKKLKSRKKLAVMIIKLINELKLKRIEMFGEIGIKDSSFETVVTCAAVQILTTNLSLFLMNRVRNVNEKPIVNVVPCFDMNVICLNLECIIDINLLRLISKVLYLSMKTNNGGIKCTQSKTL